ncbi:MAG: hypothetical protein U9N59_12225 [Campylobacterota bacterium]|nr:hypothetical protein [Campylobacterota bacterium]
MGKIDLLVLDLMSKHIDKVKTLQYAYLRLLPVSIIITILLINSIGFGAIASIFIWGIAIIMYMLLMDTFLKYPVKFFTSFSESKLGQSKALAWLNIVFLPFNLMYAMFVYGTLLANIVGDVIIKLLRNNEKINNIFEDFFHISNQPWINMALLLFIAKSDEDSVAFNDILKERQTTDSSTGLKSFFNKVNDTSVEFIDKSKEQSGQYNSSNKNEVEMNEVQNNEDIRVNTSDRFVFSVMEKNGSSNVVGNLVVAKTKDVWDLSTTGFTTSFYKKLKSIPVININVYNLADEVINYADGLPLRDPNSGTTIELTKNDLVEILNQLESK